MFTPHSVILTLKIAVGAVTLLFAASLVAIALGKRRLHGRINIAFFVLTMTAVLGFEVVIRFVNTELTAQFTPEERQALTTHLYFSVPAALVLPLMLFSGLRHRRWHVPLAVIFTTLWIGTFVTGVFYLPH